ncbi:MAG TPA: transglutaminase domain-containing protein [Aliidongia sp.]|nr:transglutaminase domain-containing protein [Aliidongia sp.]
MKLGRRDFVKGGLALSAMASLPAVAKADVEFAPSPGEWRNFEVTTRLDILHPAAPTRAWVPVPSIEAADWIRPGDYSWDGNGRLAGNELKPYGAKLVFIEWGPDISAPTAFVKSTVMTRDRAVDLTKPKHVAPLSAAEHALFTAPTRLIPIDGLVKKTSNKITAGAHSDVEKAHRIYEWIVLNTFRDPKVRGCGLGDISFMLKTGDLGGKCADLNALFVGLARAAGLPARDLYGIRVAPSRFGYKSLGANSEIITKAQHCRAEVFLTNFGWVPVDPADVRKVVLEEPPGNLPLDHPKVQAARRTLFGAWEGNWIPYNDAHDVALPQAAAPPQGFFMYPEAEAGGERLDSLDADSVKYVIEAREVTA